MKLKENTKTEDGKTNRDPSTEMFVGANILVADMCVATATRGVSKCPL